MSRIKILEKQSQLMFVFVTLQNNRGHCAYSSFPLGSTDSACHSMLTFLRKGKANKERLMGGKKRIYLQDGVGGEL